MTFKCIGLLGDSIGQGYYSDNNEGWFGKLVKSLNKENDMYYSCQNMAVDGERSPDMFHRFHSEALTKNLDILFIAIGVNDTIRWDYPETQMDVSEGLRNEIFRRILPIAKEKIEQIYIVSLLPVLEDRYPAEGWFDRPLYHVNNDIINYNSFLKNLCDEFKIDFIDVSKVWLENNPEELLFDSGHPNDKGHQIIADEIFKQVKGKI